MIWGYPEPVCTVYCVLGPLSEVHGCIVIGPSCCVACDFEGGFVIVDVDAFGHYVCTFGVDVRNTSTLHRSGVSAI